MKIRVKNYLSHLVQIFNAEPNREKIKQLESQIEQLTTEAELHKLTEDYHHRMNHVHALQYQYLEQTGKYHPFGVYKKIRSRE